MCDFSSDYEKLWSLIDDGNVLVGFVNYKDSDGDELTDVVKISRNKESSNAYRIGYRGGGFGWEVDKNEFIKTCNSINLKYIIPDFSTFELTTILTALESYLENFADTSRRFKRYPQKGIPLIISKLKTKILKKLYKEHYSVPTEESGNL